MGMMPELLAQPVKIMAAMMIVLFKKLPFD